MLKLKDVSKFYYQDGVIAVGFSKVNLELHLGEFVVITGESGSGKSTLLNVLSGLDTYEDGEMFINGKETSHYTEEDYQNYRRKYVSNIFQNFNLVNSYTVYENIELTMLVNGKKKKDVKKDIDELINKVGLKKYRNTPTSKLSGGQKQRVAIARALANDTPIIVADEPTGNLDSQASKNILKLLHEISKEKLVIVVTHQLDDIVEYATRLIKMHDGKILENRVIENINLDHKIEAKEIKNITLGSKIRLGFRNTFNLPIKFVLMFIIFLLISVTLLSNYGILKMAEYEELSYAHSIYFNDDSDKRVIIKKNDGTIFNENDYKQIEKLANVDYIVKNDLLNDQSIYLNNGSLYLDGTILLSKIDHVDLGRLPENDNEIVICGSKDSWYLSSMKDELLDYNYIINDDTTMNNIKIVGIIYNDDLNNYNFKFYLNDNLLKKIENKLYKNYTNTYFNFDNKDNNNLYFDVIPSKGIKSGEVLIKDEYNYNCENESCLNKTLNIKVQNIYYSDELNLNITNIYNKYNSKSLTGYNYDDLENQIFINDLDYQKLFNKGNYQSSIFIKRVDDLKKTDQELNNLGFTTLNMRDAKVNEMATIMQIFKIFRLIITCALIFVLFFIAYFIIKIIYKSRNSYYTTLRTLGAKKSVSINILMNELIILATLAYSIFLIFIFLVKKNIIEFSYFKEITSYIGTLEYILVYIILLLLSILIAYRYGRKIFTRSIIKNYGERI